MYFDQDATISTVSVSGNCGNSQILDVWSKFDDIKNKKYLARILAKVTLTGLNADISSGIVPNPITNSAVSAYLKLFNINHAEEQAFEYTLNVFPLTRIWSEGNGNRIDTFTHTGYTNWNYASSTAQWTSTGGDYVVDSNSGSQYFKSGFEDLTINMKNILNNWLNGSSANCGILVKMDDIAETLTGSLTTNTQFYRKSFHSRTTNYPIFSPYIELQWSDEIKDYRNIVKVGTSSNLYFYNVVNGIFTDIDSITGNFPGNIVLSGSTAGTTASSSSFVSILTGLTGSRIKTGIYSVTFTLPNSASVYNIFKDKWTITSSSSAISTSAIFNFNIASSINPNDNYENKNFNVKLLNFKNEILKGTNIIQKIFVKQELTQNRVLTAGTTALSSFTVEDGYYRLVADKINFTEIDWSPLSFDKNYNFFNINTNNFSRNIDYRIDLKFNINGNVYIFSDINNIFKII